MKSKIAIWWNSGEPAGLAGLTGFCCSDQILAASKEGVGAVIALPSWADQTARNIETRDILLAQHPQAFIAKMQQCGQGFAHCEDSLVPGMSPEDFVALALPILVFRSSVSDIYRTRRNGEWVHELLTNSMLFEPPWGDREWNYVSTFSIDPTKRLGHFERLPLFAPPVLEYLSS